MTNWKWLRKAVDYGFGVNIDYKFKNELDYIGCRLSASRCHSLYEPAKIEDGLNFREGVSWK